MLHKKNSSKTKKEDFSPLRHKPPKLHIFFSDFNRTLKTGFSDSVSINKLLSWHFSEKKS